MTKEQLNSWNRIKAVHAFSNDQELEAGTYHTHDIKVILDFIEEQENKLSSVKSDLEELIDTYKEFESCDMKAMLKSILMFMET